ncbi:MAG: hypothetical protein AAGE52_00300 [Myxococcota bacterium]
MTHSQTLVTSFAVLSFPLLGCFIDSEEIGASLPCIACHLEEQQPPIVLGDVVIPVQATHRMDLGGVFSVERSARSNDHTLEENVTIIGEDVVVHATVDGVDLGDARSVAIEKAAHEIRYAAEFDDGVTLSGTLCFQVENQPASSP